MGELTIINRERVTMITRPPREVNVVSGEEMGSTYYKIWHHFTVDELFPDKTEGFVKFKYVSKYRAVDLKIFEEDSENALPTSSQVPFGTDIRIEKSYIPSQKPQPRQPIGSFIAVYSSDGNEEEISQTIIWKYL